MIRSNPRLEPCNAETSKTKGLSPDRCLISKMYLSYRFPRAARYEPMVVSFRRQGFVCAGRPSSLLHARLLCCYEAHTNLHFHACPEQVKDRHKAVDGEAAEIRVADAGEIGRGNSGEPVRAAHAQTFPVHRLHDLGREDRLELLSIGTLVAEVAKYVPAPAYDFQPFLFHRNFSFKLFRRYVIKSISCCWVLMPCVDFFWNA